MFVKKVLDGDLSFKIFYINFNDLNFSPVSRLIIKFYQLIKKKEKALATSI